MAVPALVADCIKAMRDAVSIPVTVKCRIGIDDQSEDAPLDEFIGRVKEAGCESFTIHARKAWLQGLSPKENREIPPLNYPRVYRLKRENPDLEIILNGGIENLAEAETHLQYVDGVMLGRAAYHTPFILSEVDAKIFNAPNPVQSREQALENFMPYIEKALSEGLPLARITRHILGLYHGQYGGRAFRRILSEEAHKPGAGVDVLTRAIAATKRAEAA
jgi:tRNA-dihydrouridine synthase A